MSAKKLAFLRVASPRDASAVSPARDHALDGLRGFAIVLAMVEHYIAFLQIYYAGYFREMRLIETGYAAYKPRLGTLLSMDDGLHALAVGLIPWLTQLYVFLAAANLARRDRAAFKAVYPQKMKMFAVLFLAFTVEQTILARDFGEMLLFGPTQLWCFLLALVATLYRFGGVWPVAALFAAGWARFLLPMRDLERGVQHWFSRIHPSAFIDAWPDVFLLAATAGFLFAYVLKPETMKLSLRKRYGALLAAAASGIAWYKIARPPYDVPRDRIFANEHLVSGYASGQAGVLGMLVLVTLAAALVDRSRWSREWPLLGWAGRQMLPLYLIHKIFFLFFWMPARDYLGVRTGHLPELTVYEIFPAVACCLAFVWMVQKVRLFELLSAGKTHA